METSRRQLQHTQDMNFMQPEPVITYDHMNELEHINYIRRVDKNLAVNRTALLSDGLLIVGMLATLLMLSF